eukprot:11783-Hanusia_phi.AAC.1
MSKPDADADKGFVDKAIESCMPWSKFSVPSMNALGWAKEDLKRLRFWMRVQETIWIYQSCKKLDQNDEKEGELRRTAEDMMAYEEAGVQKLYTTYSFEQVMTGEEFWRDVNRSVFHASDEEMGEHEVGSGADEVGEGVIDTKELEKGFLRLTWYHFFYCDCVCSEGQEGGTSKMATKIYDIWTLPGWNRAYPAGPARLFDWLKYVDSRPEAEKQGALFEAANEFFQKEN